MPEPHERRPVVVGWFAALAGACAAATVVTFLVAIRTAEGQRIDDAARGRLSPFDEPGAYSATESLLETISVSSLALFGLGIMAIAIIRGRPRLALGAGAVVLGANLTTQILKEWLDRPDLIGDLRPEAGAFPSGHVTVAMSLAMAPGPGGAARRALAGRGGRMRLREPGRRGRARARLAPPQRGGRGLPGQRRLGGRGGGRDRRRVGDARSSAPAGPSPATRVGAVAAVVGGAVFVAVVGVTAVRRLDVIEFVGDSTAFAAAALAVVATCALLGGVMTALLQRAGAPPGG